MRRRDEKFPDNGFEAWGGYMNAKIAKLEEQFTSRTEKEETQQSNIFNGVSIYVNGYTIPSADELKILMSKHGGVYHTYQRSEDYIIASNLPDTKVKNMSLAKVVKPEWIINSIESNQLLDYRDYLLYRNPRAQLTLDFKITKIEKNFDNGPQSKNNIIELSKTKASMDVIGKNMQDLIEAEEIKSELPTASDKNKLEDFVPDNDVKVEKKITSTKTASDPNFISEFYNNSRLHHISQLGACFKQLVNDLRENHTFIFAAREILKQRIFTLNSSSNLSPISFERGNIIMHIDMDCFFVSVGLRKRPELRGKPVAVTHSKGGQGQTKRPGTDRTAEFNLYRQKLARKLCLATGKAEDEVEFESRVDNIGEEDDKYGSLSEIASCSYEARAKGVSNGMFMGAALKLCPDLQTISYDFDGYKEVAYTLYNTVAQYTLDIEAVSCDEMYVDCTDLLKELNVDVQDFATVLRNEIREKTGCPCSTGFGGNRLQARLATKKAKPDGQFFLTVDLVEDFMFDIKLRDLPGVGRQTAQKLESLGHHTCGSLQSLTLANLKSYFGNKTGAQLFDQCRGRDLQPLTFHTVRKSVSAEVNYGIRFENNDQCFEFLKQLSAEVHSRMVQFKVLGKCITLKLMIRAAEAPVETAKFLGHGFCDVINKSTSLNNATDNLEIITKEVISICKKQNIDPKEMRGIGIQMSKLEPFNSKQTVGAINKFLTVKNIKQETKIQDYTLKAAVNANSETKVKTPSKPKPISPKKSPVLGLQKSPTIKKRGRPPKNSKRNANPSRNLMSKFLQGTSGFNRDTPYKDPMIRDNYIEIATEIESSEEKPLELIDLSWDKVRELLRAWLDSGLAPLPCDMQMIAQYMREMVINRNIDKLIILLNFLRRRTRELEFIDWTNVYDHCIEQVQAAMLAIYGKRLCVDD